MHHTIKLCKSLFRFYINNNLSPQRNASLLLGQKNSIKYFTTPINKAFHNLCKKQILPKTLMHAIGKFDLKFCIKKCHPQLNLNDSIDRFLRDIHIKCMFGFDSSPNDYNPRLYIKNNEIQPNPAEEALESCLDNFRNILLSHAKNI